MKIRTIIPSVLRACHHILYTDAEDNTSDEDDEDEDYGTRISVGSEGQIRTPDKDIEQQRVTSQR
jgi:hypothetical protein